MLSKIESQVHNSDLAYCQNSLLHVSRTFAINIQCLKGDFYKTVLCAYLFCRIIDTIEDSEFLTPDTKIELLNTWNQFFPDSENRKHCLTHIKTVYESRLNEFNKPLTNTKESEIDLIRQAERVFNLYDSIQSTHKNEIIKPVQTMASGMADFQTKVKNSTNRYYQIESEDELETYCYYVAGTVGELLSGYFSKQSPHLNTHQTVILKKYDVSFGLGLQLTNIIKDVEDDLKRDIVYIPHSYLNLPEQDIHQLLKENRPEKLKKIIVKLMRLALKHLSVSIDYCLAIPKKDKEYRLFCYLPLIFAMQTMKEAAHHLSRQKKWHIKISRNQVKRSLIFTKLFAKSDYMLKKYFNSIHKQILYILENY